ncbi:uncharacterized protein V2V93DRAFT_372609 [Kockiozyma suomiensis]|uniref:uncharacterized protein n=1 Tax=Kockiozyma suomiensis TaxID=1337062 RepID=UPI0033440F59
MEQSTIELPAASSRESVEIMSSKFESMINDISARMNILIQQTCESSDKHHEQCVSISNDAAWEIERLKLVMEKCDDLDLEFAKIKRISEIVKEFKRRIAYLEKEV